MPNFRFSSDGYLCCFGKDALNVINLVNLENRVGAGKSPIVYNWQIDKKYFSKLHEAVIMDNGENNDDEDNDSICRVKVGCQSSQLNKILFFETFVLQDDVVEEVDQQNVDGEFMDTPNLTFANENISKMKVRISDDFE